MVEHDRDGRVVRKERRGGRELRGVALQVEGEAVLGEQRKVLRKGWVQRREEVFDSARPRGALDGWGLARLERAVLRAANR